MAAFSQTPVRRLRRAAHPALHRHGWQTSAKQAMHAEGTHVCSQAEALRAFGRARLPPAPAPFQLAPVVDALHGAQRPVLYVGGGCLDAAPELRELVARTGVPVAQTLMGLGTFPASDPLALQARPPQSTATV